MEPYRTPPSDVPHCPRCRTPLGVTERESEEMLGCVSCGGYFVPLEVLHRLVDAHRPETAPPPSVRVPAPAGVHVEARVVYLPCPRCGNSMNRGVFGRKSGVIVDTCRMHGTWFDARELEACEAYVEAGGLVIAERLAREEKERIARAARVTAQTDQFVVSRPYSYRNTPSREEDWDKLLDVLMRL